MRFLVGAGIIAWELGAGGGGSVWLGGSFLFLVFSGFVVFVKVEIIYVRELMYCF